MKNCSSIKAGLLIGTIILLISLIVAPMTIGYNVRKPEKAIIAENYDCYHISEIPDFIQYHISKELNTYDSNESEKISKTEETIYPLDSPMDSPWPMYCHNVRHTGRSPYSTIDNTGNEIWFIKLDKHIGGSAVIDNNNILYFGTWDFYALDLVNQSILWSYDIGGEVKSSPAIDENGIIYVGTAYGHPNRLFAFYPNGTVKWTYKTGNHVFSSPAIGKDGTIYFGKDESGSPPYSGYIIALYPNGTLKWKFKTGHFVHSDVTIGLDGTIYCGSHDGYMYALYPNNGTLKWKYKTGDWVARGACIADDGTVYFGSWDGYLYACYPNGKLKWKTGVGAVTTPVIAEDGTIYVGSDKLSAVNPDDGSIIWQYDVPGRIATGNPCISADGTIYCGTADNGNIVAINPDGTERWKLFFGGECFFAPIIDDGENVYIGSNRDQRVSGGLILTGYLHVFDKLDPDAPTTPVIEGTSKGTRNEKYNYTVKSTSPIGNDVYYWIEWGDLVINEWIGPYKSGEEVKISHSWGLDGDYLIRIKVKDVDNIWGPWSTFDVSIQRSRNSFESLFLRFLERFPHLERLLSLIRLIEIFIC